MFLEKSSKCFFGYIFPLDRRKSSTEAMVSLGGNKLAGNLVTEVILKNISWINDEYSEFEFSWLAVDIQNQLHFDTQSVKFAQCTTSCMYEATISQSIRTGAIKSAAPDLNKE